MKILIGRQNVWGALNAPCAESPIFIAIVVLICATVAAAILSSTVDALPRGRECDRPVSEHAFRMAGT